MAIPYKQHGRGYEDFLRLLTEYETRHVTLWTGNSHPSIKEVRRNAAHCLEHDIVLLYLEGEAALGFLVAGQRNMSVGSGRVLPVGYIHQIFSKAKGGGRKLVDEIEAHFRREGLKRAGLHIHVNNTDGYNFFRKLGYHPTRLGTTNAMLKEF